MTTRGMYYKDISSYDEEKQQYFSKPMSFYFGLINWDQFVKDHKESASNYIEFTEQ